MRLGMGQDAHTYDSYLRRQAGMLSYIMSIWFFKRDS
jgi:hypothetical protein